MRMLDQNRLAPPETAEDLEGALTVGGLRGRLGRLPDHFPVILDAGDSYTLCETVRFVEQPECVLLCLSDHPTNGNGDGL